MSKYVTRIFLFLLRMGIFVGIIFLLIRLGEYAYNFGYQIYNEYGVEAAPGTDMAIVIVEGESVREIAEKFERLGLIRDRKVFIVQERLSKYHGEIEAGNYVLNTSQSGNEMIEILTGHREETEESEET